jgi:hypothetical protein
MQIFKKILFILKIYDYFCHNLYANELLTYFNISHLILKILLILIALNVLFLDDLYLLLIFF